MPCRRQRLLVLNQYYWPGVEATANLLTELCEALAADYDVTVITGAAPGAAASAGAERRRDRPRPLDHVRALAALAAGGELPHLRASACSGRAMFSRAARPRRLHDRPAVHRRDRAARRRALPRAAARDRAGRLPGDRRQARPAAATRSSSARCACWSTRRSASADRVVAIGDTMKLRLEEKGVRAGADPRDPELGRRRERRAERARQPVGARAPARRSASSSCTRATSATPRTSTR